MQLSPHFTADELGVAGAEPRIVANAVQLCTLLLEPIRAQFGPIRVTNGYRPPAKNAAVGGVHDSEHLYEDGQAAADIVPENEEEQVVFDWIRLFSTEQLGTALPWDQIILEHEPDGSRGCLHIGYDSAVPPYKKLDFWSSARNVGGYSRKSITFQGIADAMALQWGTA